MPMCTIYREIERSVGRGQYELFESNSTVIFIRDKGWSFIYSKIAHPNLRIFIKPRIITKNWEPFQYDWK